ncbi:unnamed protein product [Ixodes pacificus]
MHKCCLGNPVLELEDPTSFTHQMSFCLTKFMLRRKTHKLHYTTAKAALQKF